MKMRNLLVLLLLCGDVASNPGPTKFGCVNCRSIRNKGPLIQDLVHSGGYQFLALTETHISPSDTDGLLKSVTPTDYNLVQKPRCTGKGGGVGFLYHKTISASIIPSPDITSFECVVVSFNVDHSKFSAACLYRPPGSCSNNFLDDFLTLASFLSSTSSEFLICGDVNIHLDVDC